LDADVNADPREEGRGKGPPVEGTGTGVKAAIWREERPEPHPRSKANIDNREEGHQRAHQGALSFIRKGGGQKQGALKKKEEEKKAR
jgi:hypothetical protein